ncbi:MAG: RNA polymerase sigma factor [Clostridiales bacterium]|nr:RNA polymerase sigma factor [Clostridiales bacterium]
MSHTTEKIFEVFYQNFELLRRFAVGITGDHYLAEDALQELAILIITKSSLFTDAKNPKLYLTQALRNKSIDVYHASKRDIAVDFPLDTIASEPGNNEYMALEDRELLDAIFKDCSPELKRAFYLHVADGYTIEELADEMGTTASALSSRFSRFRKKAISLNLLLLILQIFLQMRQI